MSDMPTFNGGVNKILIVSDVDPQKDVKLVQGNEILVTDQSDTSTHRFKIDYSAYIAPTVSLTISPYVLSVPVAQPILKGTVVDRIDLSWAYNKSIVSQSLTNTGGLLPPSLTALLRSYSYTALSVQSNISFTISGSDSIGSASDSKSMLFGNLMFWGKGPSKIGTLASAIEAFIEGLPSNQIKTSRGLTYYATGGVNEHHFVAYPKAWGEAIFTKGIFSGGYIRLRNVTGTLKSELGVGETESDINIVNSKGYSEAYYIYQSLFDNQNDVTTPFNIT